MGLIFFWLWILWREDVDILSAPWVSGRCPKIKAHELSDVFHSIFQGLSTQTLVSDRPSSADSSSMALGKLLSLSKSSGWKAPPPDGYHSHGLVGAGREGARMKQSVLAAATHHVALLSPRPPLNLCFSHCPSSHFPNQNLP